MLFSERAVRIIGQSGPRLFGASEEASAILEEADPKVAKKARDFCHLSSDWYLALQTSPKVLLYLFHRYAKRAFKLMEFPSRDFQRLEVWRNLLAVVYKNQKLVYNMDLSEVDGVPAITPIGSTQELVQFPNGVLTDESFTLQKPYGIAQFKTTLSLSRDVLPAVELLVKEFYFGKETSSSSSASEADAKQRPITLKAFADLEGRFLAVICPTKDKPKILFIDLMEDQMDIIYSPFPAENTQYYLVNNRFGFFHRKGKKILKPSQGEGEDAQFLDLWMKTSRRPRSSSKRSLEEIHWNEYVFHSQTLEDLGVHLTYWDELGLKSLNGIQFLITPEEIEVFALSDDKEPRAVHTSVLRERFGTSVLQQTRWDLFSGSRKKIFSGKKAFFQKDWLEAVIDDIASGSEQDILLGKVGKKPKKLPKKTSRESSIRF